MEVSGRTVCRFLNSEGYHFLQSRKKGVLTVADMRKRLKFEALLGVLGIRDNWQNNFRDKG